MHPRAVSRPRRRRRHVNARLFAPVDLLVGADVRAEGRIGHHDVEARREDAIDVDEAVVVVDAAMTVAVHDHVHLGGARGAGLGVAAEDALPCEPSHAGIDRPVLVVGGQQLPVEHGSLGIRSRARRSR